MSIAERAWNLDREIEINEKELFGLATLILDLIEIHHDTCKEIEDFFKLNFKMLELRLERASLASTSP